MKKILFYILLLVSVAASGQLPTIPGYTNINSKNQWIGGVFNQRLSAPSDTTTQKNGLAQFITGVYFGNGTWWTAVGGNTITAGYGLSGTTTFKVDTSWNGVTTWKDTKRRFDSLAAAITAGSYVNPMTQVGDIIIGGTAGAQEALHGNTDDDPKVYTSKGSSGTATRPTLEPAIVYSPTNQQPGDHPIIGPDNKTWINQPDPGGCTRLLGPVTVSKVAPLTYYVSEVDYMIGCQPYHWSGGNVTLAAGDADPGEFRSDMIIFKTTGADTLRGENSVGDVGSVPVYDPATQIPITTIRIDEDNTDDTQIGQTIIWHEGYSSGDWFWTRTATIDSAYTGVTPYEGTYTMRLSGASNGQWFQLNSRFGELKRKSQVGHLQFLVRNISPVNANRTWSIRLMRNNVQIPNSVAINAHLKGWTKSTTGTWLVVDIDLNDFQGEDLFNGIRFTDAGSGGTVNSLFDMFNFQTGLVVTPPVTPPPTASQFIGTIADLRASSLHTSATYAATLGYYAVADGGGAEYKWDGDNVTADNSGTIIRPTAISGAGRWVMLIKNHSVNVKQFGAKSDGVFDNLAAFKAAYAALPRTQIAFNQFTRGTIFLPQSDSAYYISDSLLFEDHINIIGQGKADFPFANIKLNFASGKSGISFKMGNPSGGSRASLMENVAVFGLGASEDTTKNGVWSNGLIHFDNVHVENFGGNGITINTTVSGNANVSHCDNCSGQQNGLDGLRIDGGESSAISVINPDFQFNGRFNIHDNGFLGSVVVGGHTSGAGMRSGHTSDAIASNGGHYYVCKVYHINKEPGVAGDWQDYWEDVGTGIEIPGSVAAWSSGTTYHEAANYGATGDAQAARVIGLYREGGTGGDISKGAIVDIGGPGANYFKKRGALLSGRDGYITAESGQGFQSRGSTNSNEYTRLDADKGLVIGGITSGADIQIETKVNLTDSIITLSSLNDGVPRMAWTGAALIGTKLGIGPHLTTAGLPMFGKFGFGMFNVRGSSNYAGADSIRRIFMGTGIPVNEGPWYAAGDIVFNMKNIKSSGIIGYQANKLTQGGDAADFDTIYNGSASGGGGGGGLPTGLAWDNSTKIFDMSTIKFKDNSGSLWIRPTTGAIDIIDQGSNPVVLSIYNGDQSKQLILTAVGGITKVNSAGTIYLGMQTGSTDKLTIGNTVGNSDGAKFEVMTTTMFSIPCPPMTNSQKGSLTNLIAGATVYCSDCTATDASTGVNQTYNGSTWKNWW